MPAHSENRVVLSATVLEAQPMRYTPAGLAVLDMQLEHSSQVRQAGHQRTVELSVPAVAMGDVAHMLADSALGTRLTISGFLAPSRKGSSRLVVHIQEARRMSPDSTPVVV